MSETIEPTPPARPRGGAIRRWSVALLAIGVVGFLGAQLFGSTWPFTFVTPMARQIAVALTLGTIGLALPSGRSALAGLEPQPTTRKTGPLKWACRTALAVLIVAAWLVAILVRVEPLASATSNGPTLKILSANVHSSNADHASLIELIRREKPDVVLLMELTSPWIEALDAIKADYPTRRTAADDAGNFGIGVWTKLSCDDAQLLVRQHGPEPSLLDVAHAELSLSIDGHRVRFLGVHPLPPLTPAMKSARDDLLGALADDIAKQRVPTIFAGDFNATRYCPITRNVARRANLGDAMSGVSFSWPTTAAGYVLGTRIDQILATRDDWQLVESHAGTHVGSDHLPMIATLRLAAR